MGRVFQPLLAGLAALLREISLQTWLPPAGPFYFRGRGSGTWGTLWGSAQQLGSQGSGALHHQPLVTSEQEPALKEVAELLFHIFQMPSPLPSPSPGLSVVIQSHHPDFSVFLLNSGEPLPGLSHPL